MRIIQLFVDEYPTDADVHVLRNSIDIYGHSYSFTIIYSGDNKYDDDDDDVIPHTRSARSCCINRADDDCNIVHNLRRCGPYSKDK